MIANFYRHHESFASIRLCLRDRFKILTKLEDQPNLKLRQMLTFSILLHACTKEKVSCRPEKNSPGQCATGSKILTEPEPNRIGIILAGTAPDYEPEKVNRIRPDWQDRPNRPDFYRIFKALTLNLQVTNINMHGSSNFEI